MTDTDRQRLAAILGMLGSEHAGERASAALHAEAFRHKHGLTWAEMIDGKTVYLGGNPPWHTTPEPQPPEPPQWTPPPQATLAEAWGIVQSVLIWAAPVVAIICLGLWAPH